MPSSTVSFYHIDPGRHLLSLTTESGTSVTLVADFDESQMATSRGRSWWCVGASVRDSDHLLVLRLETQQVCQRTLEFAPEHDDPGDYPEAK